VDEKNQLGRWLCQPSAIVAREAGRSKATRKRHGDIDGSRGAGDHPPRSCRCRDLQPGSMPILDSATGWLHDAAAIRSPFFELPTSDKKRVQTTR
jgi:hypothetical protein